MRFLEFYRQIEEERAKETKHIDLSNVKITQVDIPNFMINTRPMRYDMASERIVYSTDTLISNNDMLEELRNRINYLEEGMQRLRNLENRIRYVEDTTRGLRRERNH